jgi:DNA-binding MarR family transcriptional regulator
MPRAVGVIGQVGSVDGHRAPSHRRAGHHGLEDFTRHGVGAAAATAAPSRRQVRPLWHPFPPVPDPLPFDPIDEAARQWRKHWGQEPVPSMAAVTSIMRVQQILTARLNALLKPHGLTFSRYEALMLLYLSRNGALPLGKMGERLQVHATSVTNAVDGLERLGYVRRSPHQSDRRRTLASITEAGRTVAEEATTALNEARFGTMPLAVDELEALSGLLRTLRADEGDFEGD